MRTFKIKSSVRDGFGKNKVKKLRKEGFVPVVVYGHGDKTMHVTMPAEDVVTTLKKLRGEPGFIEIDIGKKEKSLAVIKEFQKDILTDKLLHVDLQLIHPGEPLKISVPVIPIGTPEGVKAGGIIETVIREIEIEAIPSKIPDHIELDVSQLNIGDSIHVKDIEFDEGVEHHHDEQQLVIAIVTPKATIAAEAEEKIEEEGEEGEEEVTTVTDQAAPEKEV